MMYKGRSRLHFIDEATSTNFIRKKLFRWQLRSGDRRDRIDWLSKILFNGISDQGYHIELTGDEFEPFVMSARIS